MKISTASCCADCVLIDVQIMASILVEYILLIYSVIVYEFLLIIYRIFMCFAVFAHCEYILITI